MKTGTISKATLERLPQYLAYLKLISEKEEHISATTIARALGLGEVTVRKDLCAVCDAGKPKRGYPTETLIQALNRELGFSQESSAVVVGAGKMGVALMDYRGFEDFGLSIIAGFDSNPEKCTSLANGKPVYPMDVFGAFCKKHDVRIGIITVPKAAAQEACDAMLDAGISAIWNFTQVELQVPKDVVVCQENLALSLAHLKNRQRELIQKA